MTFFPIIARELRTSSRQPMTFWLRPMGASAALVACVMFALNRGFRPSEGGELFGSLHTVLFFAIWILVPLLTADCISRERREGTLGLLFLTRLRATDIVMAKGFVHGLRSLTLWLSVLPMVAIPILMGGVSPPAVLFSILLNFSALCWALAAALLASSYSRSWAQALVMAVGFAAATLPLMGLILAALVMPIVPLGFGVPNSWETLCVTGYEILLEGVTKLSQGIPSWPSTPLPMGFWANIGPSSLKVGFTGLILWVAIELAVFSMLILLCAVFLTGRRTRRIWQEKPPSRLRKWYEDRFCRPMFFTSLFRGWMRRKLQKNPVGWLEQRTVNGRLVTWGWLAVLVSVYTVALFDPSSWNSPAAFMRQDFQPLLAYLLAGSIALSAAGSFRRERESGVMELLLVSPVNEWGMIFGRLKGLWGQFFLAFGLLLGIWVFFANFTLTRGDTSAGPIMFFTITFWCLPAIGLYFSLRWHGFMTAFVWTISVGLLAPPVLSLAGSYVFEPWKNLDSPLLSEDAELSLSAGSAFWQLVLALICLALLHRRLKRRNFRMAELRRVP